METTTLRATWWSLGLFLLLAMCGQPSAASLPPGISGSWYNPAQSGHGLSIEILDAERALLFWYTTNPEGEPLYLYIEGVVDGFDIHGDAYVAQGMRFGEFDPADQQLARWGEVDLSFSSCSKADLRYAATGDAGQGFGEGELPLRRLTAIAGLPCDSDFPATGLFDGTLQAAGVSSPVTLLLGQDGSAWLMGLPAVREPSFVWGGRHGYRASAPQLSIQGATEQAIAGFSAGPQTHPLAEVPIRSLSLRRDGGFGSYHATAVDFDGASLFELTLQPRQVQLDNAVRSAVAYRRDLAVADLAGSWSAMHGFLNAVHRELVVLADGSFTGRDFGFGNQVPCTYTGDLAMVRPGTVEFIVRLQASGCGLRDGEYIGRGWVEDLHQVGDNGRLRFAAMAWEGPSVPVPVGAFQFAGSRDGSP